MFNWKEFKEGKIAVHCDTEEKANDFLKGCDEQGIIWVGNYKCTMYNGWAYNREGTCYCCLFDYGKLGLSTRIFYESKGIKTIDWKIKGEKKTKYKVGDRVKVKGNLKVGFLYGDVDFIHTMIEFKTVTIRNTEIISSNNIGYRVRENRYLYTDEMLDGLATDYPKIYITTDGKTTVATKTLNGEVVKTAAARCCPEDKFNFEIGAKLALVRLCPEALGENETKKPKFIPHLEYSFGENCGNIGDKTNLTAIFGEKLFVGDVVEIYDTDENENYGFRLVAKDKDESFIMGVRGFNFKNGISENWQIRKVKSFKDLKDREIIDGIKVVLK